MDAVFPEGGPAKCKWVDEVRLRLKPFFDIPDHDDDESFVRVAADILFDLEHNVVPVMNAKVLKALADACLTTGWPKVSRIAEDEPKVVYNLTNEEIIELMGGKMPSPEERERINRECREETIRDGLEGAEASTENLFGRGEWYLKSDVEIALWRLARAACEIARKAQRDHDYYFCTASEAPPILLSALLSPSRPEAFASRFSACSAQVCEQLPRMLLNGYRRETLMPASLAAGAGVRAMMHYLDGLPHDSHLNAAARAAEKWITRLGDIVHGTRRLEKSCREFIEAANLFGEELQLASDALSEYESKVRQRLERAARGDDPLIDGIVRRLKKEPILATVDGYSKFGRQEALEVARSKGPVKGLFTQTNLANLFGTHVNTIANWMGGKTAIPDGFVEALDRKDYDGMIACAKIYRSSRNKIDVMNAKLLVRNTSDELLFKLGANLPDGRCESPQ